MQDLGTLRTRWAKIEVEETRLLREMTVAESLRQFAVLYETLAPRLSKGTAYHTEREAALIEQQRRLQPLAQWLADQIRHAQRVQHVNHL
jgi:hypothetical protein